MTATENEATEDTEMGLPFRASVCSVISVALFKAGC
jgi:hypothetical protein